MCTYRVQTSQPSVLIIVGPFHRGNWDSYHHNNTYTYYIHVIVRHRVQVTIHTQAGPYVMSIGECYFILGQGVNLFRVSALPDILVCKEPANYM